MPAVAYGELFAAVSLAGVELARVERDGLGREVARQAGAVRQTQAFDPQGRLARQAGVGAGGAAVFSRRYGYDAADQLTRVEDAARGVRAYQYDACERLLGVAGSDPERFVVDPAGNILAAGAGAENGAAAGVAGAGAVGGDPARGDRLRRFRGREGERTFAYDARGNRVAERREVAGGALEEVAYRYGADDQLREVRRVGAAGGRVTRFGYDALGRRVWKATARLTSAALLAAGVGATAPTEVAAEPEPAADAWTRTAFVWSDDVLLAESDRADVDALATVYAYEPGGFRPLAQARRETADGDAAVYHYHVDHLGTPQELTDALGRVVWQAEYRAWGAVARERVAAVAQPLRFQGQYADGETGLYYNRHRYYSPGEGRFVSQDPIRLFGGENLGAYAPNPVEWVDPLGLACDFANPRKAAEHYAKHAKGVIVGPNGAMRAKPGGADMPEFGSFRDYRAGAQRFLDGPPAPGVLERVRANGDIVRLQPSTGEFGIKTPNDVIRTFFRPDGDAAARMDYFLNQ